MRLFPRINKGIFVGVRDAGWTSKRAFGFLGETSIIFLLAVESWERLKGYRSKNVVSVAFYHDEEGFCDYWQFGRSGNSRFV